ncbi:MAG: hypothetical protein JWM85_1431 [Acidimicrobiaceae bacterium]|nr:hypothetical protein [Acidimicrobiaceae bacterium]
MPLLANRRAPRHLGRLSAIPGALALLAVVPVAGEVLLAPSNAGASAPRLAGPGITTVGVTIDRGNYATATQLVTLNLVWPTGATAAQVSNDSAFDAAGGTRTIAPATSASWTLSKTALSASGGTTTTTTSPTTTSTTIPVVVPTRSETVATLAAATRTVYVQFTGPNISPVSASAHIVLDETTPTMSDAQLLPRTKGAFRVRVVASENVSGIASVQIAPATRGGVTTTISPTTRRGYSQVNEVLSAKTAAAPRYVRTRSLGGTWSSWMPVTPELTAVHRLHGGSLTTAPSGAIYRMRGFDYQPVRSQMVAGVQHYLNDTFSTSLYNHVLVAKTLAQMASLHYNSVRVFVNVNGVAAAKGLNPGYVANMANFIRTAQQDGIRVLLVTGELPSSPAYTPRNDARYGLSNLYFLSPAAIKGKERYLSDLVSALRTGGAPLSDVMWELAGEQNWDNKTAPLSWKSGLVKVADGGTFNMASAASRAAMEDSSLLYWMNTMTAELHRLVPGSLVGVGFYAPSINAKRPQWTVRPQAVFGANALNDFVDVHAYSNLGTLAQQIDSFNAASTTKPVIMGEFGAARSSYATPAVAAKAVVQWQQQTCRLGGFSVTGWLLWTWNSSAQLEYWTALDGSGAIERAMAPVARPNPCG